MTAVLGIDLASRSWAANGSARLELESPSGERAGHGAAVRPRVVRVVPGAITWPSTRLTPEALAAAILACARAHRVVAVAIDGPHAWRDPATPSGAPGVGRRGEFALRTQGKTGVYGRAYPSTQLGWTAFSIRVFDVLLAEPGVRMAAPEDGGTQAARPGGPRDLLLLESYPTAVWRAAGLAPLPAKARRPDVAAAYARLAAAFGLPPADVRGHDDLQAVAASLPAAGLAGGVADARAHGGPVTWVDAPAPHRVEGYVWDAVPRGFAGGASDESGITRRSVVRALSV